MTLRADWVDSGDPALELRRVDTGPLQLVFLPSVGGRLLSLRYDGVELLWVNPAVFDEDFRAVRPRSAWPKLDGTFASWTNVGGSKSWPAPQGWGGAGEWAGPPDAVLDAGEYSFDAAVLDDGRLRVEMRSGFDARTGLRITRTFLLTEGARQFELELTYTNESSEPVRWALWEVAQVVTGTADGPFEGAAAHVSGASVDAVIDLGRYAGAPAVFAAPGGVIVPVVPGVAKFGFPDSDGTVSLESAGRPILQLSTVVVADGRYPDGGSRAEIWMQSPLDESIAELSGLQPDAWLAELELLSPLRALACNESASMMLRWVVSPPSS